jgi:hypothetical protein
VGLFRRSPSRTETVHSAATRFETVQPGITTWHSFSASGHYDAGNVGFGSLVGVDEHLVEPGAGFADHAHRGVDILSWVLEGVLRHEDCSGRVELVEPGTVLHQSAGSGIRHTESNASTTEPLHFLQLTLVGDTGAPACGLTEPPVHVAGLGLFSSIPGKVELELPSAYLHVTRGSFSITGHPLRPGDSVRATGSMAVAGTGELLVWTSGTPL